MNGPVPPSHSCADGFLLRVLTERRSFLSKLGMEGRGQITHWVVGTLVVFKEHLFGELAKELSHASMQDLFFGTT
jgi:hypothetical protein